MSGQPPETVQPTALASLEHLRRDHQALGQLLEAYRPYLLQIANEELPPELRGKAGASDLVQQTFLEAHRDFVRFRGDTEAELRTWLKQILEHNLANFSRTFRAQKRFVGRELQFDPSEQPVAAGEQPSASSIFRAREEATQVDAALARLSPEHQQAIILRNRERRSFLEIGQVLNRSPEAARKLWARAIERLQEELEAGAE